MVIDYKSMFGLRAIVRVLSIENLFKNGVKVVYGVKVIYP